MLGALKKTPQATCGVKKSKRFAFNKQAQFEEAPRR
jgi:hypothetical protein